LEQAVRTDNCISVFLPCAEAYLKKLGDEEEVVSLLTEEMAKVPKMLADLDDIEKNLKAGTVNEAYR
jgi:hypothetical protein